MMDRRVLMYICMPSSKENVPSMVVTAGQEYRIWYGHDLKNCTEDNNDGQVFADVYMYAIF